MPASDARAVRSSSNILLRRLAPADQLLLEDHAEQVVLPRGATIARAGDRLDAVYFPETVIVSLEEHAGPAGQVEIAVIGREGMVGWPALLGSPITTHAAVVQSRAGQMLRVAVEPLRRACQQSSALSSALLQFVQTVIVQMARAIASHLNDTLDLRLARWILMRHDRLGGDILFIRHEDIAENLNVRRASITDHLHLLEGKKVIRCNRGRIAIRDRCALETLAGPAYGASETYYRSLIAPFGKSLDRQP